MIVACSFEKIEDCIELIAGHFCSVEYVGVGRNQRRRTGCDGAVSCCLRFVGVVPSFCFKFFRTAPGGEEYIVVFEDDEDSLLRSSQSRSEMISWVQLM